MTLEHDSEVLQLVLEEIPIEYRDRFATVVDGPSQEVGALRAQIDAYTGMVRKVSAWVTSLDPDIAERIGATCVALLDRYGDGRNSAIVGATATYFIEEDEDDEITGVLGFDDDIQVVNAVCRVLGAEDLLLPLIR